MAKGWFAANPKRLIRRIAHIREGHGRVGTQVSRNTADAIAQSARGRVHVITGQTKESIHAVQVNAYMAMVVAEGPGAVAEEYGTRFRPPHPFLHPAAAEVEPRARQEFKQVLLDLYKERG